MNSIHKLLLQQQQKINQWLDEQLAAHHPAIYCSVDIRDAGYKVAAIDTNLFPSGFNNLNQKQLDHYSNMAKTTLNPNIQSILIISESITHNIHYYENLNSLSNILINAGYQVAIGTLLKQVTEPKQIKLPNDETITLFPITRKTNQLITEEFTPDIILLNNDLSVGIPDILENIEQDIIPPAKLGWSSRLKSQHFNFYQSICEQLSNEIDIDPWLLFAEYRSCDDIYILSHESDQKLQDVVDDLLTQVTKKYNQYDIKQQPYAVIKSNHGTYGISVMMVNSADDITKLKRIQRTTMSSGKDGTVTKEFIIQEGIYTTNQVTTQNAIAEPVIYLMDSNILGGFYRYHRQCSQHDNLNTSGSEFLPFSSDNQTTDQYSCYQIIAKIAALATAYEIEAIG